MALSFGDGVFNLNGTYKKIGGTAGTGSQDLLFESATTGNTTVNVSVGSELVGIGDINADYLTVNFANITSTFRYNVFGNAIVNYPQKNTDVSLPSINIQSFPETLIDGAQNINAGFWGYRKKMERNITATRGGAIVQANHTSGTYAFAIYNAITKQLLGATNFANFGDNTTGNIYADFVQTVELQKDQEVYIVMYINYTSQRYLGCRTFRSELSGSGDIFGNGVMQTILYGSSMDVLSEITTSDISITYPNQNNIVAPYIEISGN